MFRAAAEALRRRNTRCLELCDLLLTNDDADKETRRLKAEALDRMAEYETSANGDITIKNAPKIFADRRSRRKTYFLPKALYSWASAQ